MWDKTWVLREGSHKNILVFEFPCASILILVTPHLSYSYFFSLHLLLFLLHPAKIFSRHTNFPGHVWRKGGEARNEETPIMVLTVPSAEHRSFSPPFSARRHVTFAVAAVFKTREHKREISGECLEKERIQDNDIVEKCLFFLCNYIATDVLPPY